MTLTEARRIFDLDSKTAEQGAQDLEEWTSSSMSRAEALFEGGFISARDRSDAERMAADAQKIAYELRGVSYL